MSRLVVPQSASAVPLRSVIDYLQPDINRPDLYERDSVVRDPAGVVQRPGKRLLESIVLICISAFLFIAIFSWANVLKVYYDSIFVSSLITQEFYATLYYSLTVTGVCIVVASLLIYFLLQNK